jgi:hypothetical protein
MSSSLVFSSCLRIRLRATRVKSASPPYLLIITVSERPVIGYSLMLNEIAPSVPQARRLLSPRSLRILVIRKRCTYRQDLQVISCSARAAPWARPPALLHRPPAARTVTAPSERAPRFLYAPRLWPALSHCGPSAPARHAFRAAHSSSAAPWALPPASSHRVPSARRAENSSSAAP